MTARCHPAVTLFPGELVKLGPGLPAERVVSVVQKHRMMTLRLENAAGQVRGFRMNVSTPVLVVEEKGTES